MNKKIKSLLEWYKTQSLTIIFPLIIFIITYVVNSITIFLSKDQEASDLFLYALWEGKSENEQITIIFHFVFVAFFIVLQIFVNYNEKKEKDKKRMEEI
jgi:quinol-cytochrome oxidoreductase complex cytochrome b subunit